MKNSAIVTPCQHKKVIYSGLENIYLKHYNLFKTWILVTKFDFPPLLFLGLRQLPNGDSQRERRLGYLPSIKVVKRG